jgi:hypothetical protein
LPAEGPGAVVGETRATLLPNGAASGCESGELSLHNLNVNVHVLQGGVLMGLSGRVHSDVGSTSIYAPEATARPARGHSCRLKARRKKGRQKAIGRPRTWQVFLVNHNVRGAKLRAEVYPPNLVVQPIHVRYHRNELMAVDGLSKPTKVLEPFPIPFLDFLSLRVI